MSDARKRDEVLVEQRQGGRCGRSGHVSTPVNVPRAGAKRIKRLIDPRRAAQGGDRAEPAGREALGDQLAGIENARGIEASLDAAQRRQPRRAVEFGQYVALHLSDAMFRRNRSAERSEEHTSELQSLMRISYAVFCLKK